MERTHHRCALRPARFDVDWWRPIETCIDGASALADGPSAPRRGPKGALTRCRAPSSTARGRGRRRGRGLMPGHALRPGLARR